MTLDWNEIPPERLLHERFGLQRFHPGQREIIEQLVNRKRVLAIQQTGWGKSLCYQLASLYLRGVAIVISPLKALMRDQCRRCQEVLHIPAAIVSSDAPDTKNRELLKRAAHGEIKILYITPERLGNRSWQEYASQMNIGMVVIDEAHCISIWGHDFRPEYRRIARLLAGFPVMFPILALTATANRRVEQDILQQIGTDVLVVRGVMHRPNLHTTVVPVESDQHKLGYIAANISTWPGSGIIYTGTKASAESVAAFLQQQGREAEYYHAGRSDDERQKIEHGLMANHYKVVCSTNALGMGIDKPDIRFVIHYHIPASPIHYYQEIGRAGRDHTEATCILLYNQKDVEIPHSFIQLAKPASDSYERVLSLARQTPEGLQLKDILRTTGFSRQTVKKILVDLEEQHVIKRVALGSRNTIYVPDLVEKFDLSIYDKVRAEKEQELADMQRYTQITGCFMGYLTAYLGDSAGYHCGTCGNCRPENFAHQQPSPSIQAAVASFEHIFLPPIEKRDSMEAGYALSYYGGSEIGALVNASKYQHAGPFAEKLITLAVNAVRSHYMLTFDGIVSVPPTRSGPLVETFARSVADTLGIPYLADLARKRSAQEQKSLTNALQKQDNVRDAFTVTEQTHVAGKTLLLIDDIYDSGYTLREAAATLSKAGARAVYPLTITRTVHSDDQ